jgi:hypothetical protein
MPVDQIEWLWLWFILGATTLLIVSPVFVGPILLRCRLWVAARPTLRPLDPDSGELTGRVQRFFDHVARALSLEGFQVLGYFALDEHVPRARATIAYLEMPGSQEGALASVVYAKIDWETYRPREFRVEFWRSFLDGVGVSTNNGWVVGIHGRVPGRTSVQFAREDDLLHLYRLHRIMVARFGSDARPRVRDNTDVTTYLSRNLIAEMDRQVQIGYYFLDADAECYRPTWKGAMLMAWKSMWPITWIRWARRRLHAARLRREAEAQLADAGEMGL